MKIVYYTSGTTGSGRLVRGLSIGTALARSGIIADFTIVSSSPFGHLADILNIKHVEIPVEPEATLDRDNYETSIIYRTLSDIKPDVLIVDLLWFPLYHFIEDIPGKKIFLSRQVSDHFFSIPVSDGVLQFNGRSYNKVLAAEPFGSCIDMERIDPIILRNRDEIFDRDTALMKLGIDGDKPVCLLAYNGKPGDFKNVKKTYSYLEEKYQIVYSTNYDGGIFPVIDHFNVFDLIITGGGYNSFWETIFFNKEAIIVPSDTRFENPQVRIGVGADYKFRGNGADQLVDIIMNL